MVELLVVLTIVAVLAALVAPNVTDGLGLSNMTVIRQQAKSTQGALDAWLVASPTLGSARQQFNPKAISVGGVATTTPTDLTDFLGHFGAFLSADNRTQLSVITAPDGTPALTTQAMARANAYIWISWGSDYTNSPLRANLVIP